jgi:hypothetical protein
MCLDELGSNGGFFDEECGCINMWAVRSLECYSVKHWTVVQGSSLGLDHEY